MKGQMKARAILYPPCVPLSFCYFFFTIPNISPWLFLCSFTRNNKTININETIFTLSTSGWVWVRNILVTPHKSNTTMSFKPSYFEHEVWITCTILLLMKHLFHNLILMHFDHSLSILVVYIQMVTSQAKIADAK